MEKNNISLLDKYVFGNGCASRKEFWCTFLLLIILVFSVAYVLVYFFDIHSQEFFISKCIVRIIFIIIFTSITIRRLHDIGKSGLWYLLFFTVIGSIPLFYWLAKKGIHQNNDESEDCGNTSFDTQKNHLQSIISDENIFTIEEAMACFCIGAAIVKHENQPLIPPGIFMFLDNEEFLIYKDLMMYAVYLLGIKSESNWSKIYADAEDPDKLANALKLLSQLPDKKKTCFSVFLRSVAGSDADEENFGKRVFRYHKYCVECGLREFINAGIAQRLSMKITLYNGYDYLRESYAEYIDVDELEITYEDDEELDPNYDFEEEDDEELDPDFDFEEDED